MFKFKNKKNVSCNIDFNARGYRTLKNLLEKGMYKEHRHTNFLMTSDENKVYKAYQEEQRNSERKLYEFMLTKVDFTKYINTFTCKILKNYEKFGGFAYDKNVDLFDQVGFFNIEKEFKRIANVEDVKVFDKMKEEFKVKDFNQFMVNIKEYDNSLIAFYEEKPKTIESYLGEEVKEEDNLITVDMSEHTCYADYINHLVNEIVKLGKLSTESEENEALSALPIRDEFARLEMAYKEMLDEDLTGNVVHKLRNNLLIKLEGEDLTYFEVALLNIPQPVGEV